MKFFYGAALVIIVLIDIYAVYILCRTRFLKTAPTVPSHGKAKRKIEELLEKEIKSRKGKVREIADIGAGTGTLLAKISKRHPEIEFTGYEWDAIACLILKARFFRRKNIKIIRTDAMKQEITADIVTAFLMTPQMKSFEEKTRKEKWKDKTVILNYFPFPKLKASEVHNVAGLIPWNIYVYRI